jgi:colicin import membrane protein
MSAALHGAVIALLLFFTYVVSTNVTPTPKVFELVAGEGDNFMAREAPALGTSSGVKVDIPPAPEPKPVPPQPVPQEVAPEIPATPLPTPKVVTPTPPKPAEKTVPDFKKKLQREVIVAESKAKREIKKEREKEAKRVADEQKKISKEEFDRANKAKGATPATKTASTKAPKIDAEGIAKGVVGGSTANKIGGAGGKALKTDNDDVLAAYDALFKQRLRAEFEPPPGLSDSLFVTIELRSNMDGSLTGARVVKGSGSSEFDRAVLDAIRRVRMPARPDRKSETIEFIFTMRERTER